MTPLSAAVSEAPKRHRVLLVDDQPMVRQRLSLLINQEPDLVVCGEASGNTSVLAALAQLQPDILVLDISFKGPDGIDVLKTSCTSANESRTGCADSSCRARRREDRHGSEGLMPFVTSVSA